MINRMDRVFGFRWLIEARPRFLEMPGSAQSAGIYASLRWRIDCRTLNIDGEQIAGYFSFLVTVPFL